MNQLQNITITMSSIINTSTVNQSNSTSVPELFSRYSSWPMIYSVHAPQLLYIDRIVTPIWYILGLVGNIVSAKVWSERRMQKNNPSAYFLFALALSDLCLILLHPLQELVYAWGVPALNAKGLCEMYFPLYYLPQSLSVLLVLGFTCQRYISVVHPFKQEKLCHKKASLWAILGMVIISVIYAAPQVYFWQFADGRCKGREFSSDDIKIVNIWTWVTEMLIYGLLPIISLILNICVILVLRRVNNNTPGRSFSVTSRQSTTSTAATTTLVLAVSFYLIFTTLPATIVFAVSLIDSPTLSMYYMTDIQMKSDPGWQHYFTFMTYRKVIEEICLSHYCLNFVIYMWTGTVFRIRVKELLATCLSRIKPACVNYELVRQKTSRQSMTFETKC